MKYCFLILSFLAAALSVNAQTEIKNKELLDIYKKAGVKANLHFLTKEPAKAALSGEFYVPEVIHAYEQTDSGLTVTKDSIVYDLAGLPQISVTQVNHAGSGWVNVQMDSSVYVEGKTVFNRISIWADGAWVPAITQYMEYNGQGSLMRLIGETVLPDTTRYQIDYTYNDKEQVTEYIYYTVENTELVPQARYTYTYNTAGDITEMLQQMKMGGQEWVNYSLFSYEYDETGFETRDLYKLWENNDWVVQASSVFEKNAAGLTASEVTMYRSSGVLVNTDSTVFSYDEKGNLITETASYWEEGAWVLMDSSKYAYDASDRLLSEEVYFWIGTEWLKWDKRSYEYDSNGKLVRALTEQGTMENAWENVDKVEYEYDNASNRVKGEFFVWDGGSWTSDNGDIEIEYENYSDSYSAYLVEARYLLIQDPIAVEDENLNPDKFALGQNFPNPFNPETKISFSLPQSGMATLKIYDALGREVAELVNGPMEKGAHTVDFSGKKLSSGVYIYRLQSGNFTESKKMMLLK